MIRRALSVAVFLLAHADGAMADPAEKARLAADALAEAASGLTETEAPEDRIAALTRTVQAYEAGLAALRESLRETTLAERDIRESFEEDAEGLSDLIGALTALQSAPEETALLHPGGPLETGRAAMILADMIPALEAKVSTLRAPLVELAEIAALRHSAQSTLEDGLDGVRTARARLGEAVSERIRPPVSATDTATLQAIVNGADTLEGFAATLAAIPGAPSDRPGFSERIGTLRMPVAGRTVAEYNQQDPHGQTRPGIIVATAPHALVTAPHPSTVRYAGPLLDLGLVGILEPEAGYLLIFAGLGELYATRGEVLEQNAPVGLMGGNTPLPDQKLIISGKGGGQALTETLYIELHKGDKTLDPTDWFTRAED